MATKCFICSANVSNPLSSRYPSIACHTCIEKAVDSYGKIVRFENVDAFGGFVAIHSDPNENIIRKDVDHICFINNIACYADEARFGGIVIKPKS